MIIKVLKTSIINIKVEFEPFTCIFLKEGKIYQVRDFNFLSGIDKTNYEILAQGESSENDLIKAKNLHNSIELSDAVKELYENDQKNEFELKLNNKEVDVSMLFKEIVYLKSQIEELKNKKPKTGKKEDKKENDVNPEENKG